MTPMTMKPIPTACDILMNSRLSASTKVSCWDRKLEPKGSSGRAQTLRASIEEQRAVAQEVARDFCDFFELLRHRERSRCGSAKREVVLLGDEVYED